MGEGVNTAEVRAHRRMSAPASQAATMDAGSPPQGRGGAGGGQQAPRRLPPRRAQALWLGGAATTTPKATIYTLSLTTYYL